MPWSWPKIGCLKSDCQQRICVLCRCYENFRWVLIKTTNFVKSWESWLKTSFNETQNIKQSWRISFTFWWLNFSFLRTDLTRTATVLRFTKLAKIDEIILLTFIDCKIYTKGPSIKWLNENHRKKIVPIHFAVRSGRQLALIIHIMI